MKQQYGVLWWFWGVAFDWQRAKYLPNSGRKSLYVLPPLLSAYIPHSLFYAFLLYSLFCFYSPSSINRGVKAWMDSGATGFLWRLGSVVWIPLNSGIGGGDIGLGDGKPARTLKEKSCQALR